MLKLETDISWVRATYFIMINVWEMSFSCMVENMQKNEKFGFKWKMCFHFSFRATLISGKVYIVRFCLKLSLRGLVKIMSKQCEDIKLILYLHFDRRFLNDFWHFYFRFSVSGIEKFDFHVSSLSLLSLVICMERFPFYFMSKHS